MNLVVFYSRTGNVKKAARDYAAAKGLETMEINDLVNRKGIIGFIKSGFQAKTKKCTPIGKFERDISKYDKIILCAPIWAGEIAPPARTFLKEYGSKIKEVEYVIMHADKVNQFTNVFNDMDAVGGKKRVSAKSLVVGDPI